MAAELISPVDELTGMPLVVAPPLEELPRNDPRIANWHHIYHASTSPELQTLGGAALRNSRVELLPLKWHNTGRQNYHSYYIGPPLPAADDSDTQFRLCVLACAGYLPEKVIDLNSGEPVVRLMNEDELYYFRKSPLPERVSSFDIKRYMANTINALPEPVTIGVMRNLKKEAYEILTKRKITNAQYAYNNLRYAYEPIREFFKVYALSQPIDHIPLSTIDEFLHTDVIERRREIGHWLLAKQSEVATESFSGQYKQAFKAGLLHPLMPPRPDNLVKHKLGGTIYRENKIFPQLAERLASQAA